MTAYLTDSLALALLASFAAGVLASLIYAVLTVTFLANQNVAGLTLTIFGTGLSSDCAAVLQGIILFFILASEFFVRYAFAGRSSAKGGKKA